MASREETLTQAIVGAVVELLDPSASGNRTERSILPDLYRVLSKDARITVGKAALSVCFNDSERKSVSESLNELETLYFGSQAMNYTV